MSALKALLSTWKANCAQELEAALREEAEAHRVAGDIMEDCELRTEHYTIEEYLAEILRPETVPLLEQYEKKLKACYPGTPAAVAWAEAITLLKAVKP